MWGSSKNWSLVRLIIIGEESWKNKSLELVQFSTSLDSNKQKLIWKIFLPGISCRSHGSWFKRQKSFEFFSFSLFEFHVSLNVWQIFDSRTEFVMFQFDEHWFDRFLGSSSRFWRLFEMAMGLVRTNLIYIFPAKNQSTTLSISRNVSRFYMEFVWLWLEYQKYPTAGKGNS